MTEDLFPHPSLYQASYPEGVQRDLTIPVCALSDFLGQTAAKYPLSPAFDFLGYKMNWGEIYQASLKLARALQDKGVGKGMRVGLLLPNCPYYVIAYFAIARTGATIVNFNPLYSETELLHQVNDSGTELMITADLDLLYGKAKAMVGHSSLRHILLCRFSDVLPFPKKLFFSVFKWQDHACVKPWDPVSWYADLVSYAGDPHPVEIDPYQDVALLQYTGGTTGTPKGAMLTHANIVSNAWQCALWLNGGRPGKDKTLGVLPFFHVFAMTAVMNFSVCMGFEIIALPRFDLGETIRLIHRKRPQFFPAVPAICNAINNYEHLNRYDLSSIEFCIAGGAPLPPDVKRRFEENTGAVIVEGYGLTETSPVICCNPVSGENKPGSIGLPLPGTVVEIVDSSDKKTRKAVGERGELFVKGPQVMKGYWNSPAENADVLRDGFLRTGDIAVMDEQGYVFIVDRLKDMIITNGYNVYPRNVEDAIYRNEAVEECVVAGVPDSDRGEIVKAWIKCRQGSSLDAKGLRLFLKRFLSPMEIPREVEFRTQPLPRTMVGKLSRKMLVEEESLKKENGRKTT